MRGDDDDAQQTGSTNPAGNTAPTTATTAAPPPPPPPPPKDMAKEAFDAVKTWAGDHEGEWQELARRWQGVADAHAGSEWADKAARNATAAKERADEEEQLAAQKAARAEREKAALEQRKVLNDKLKAFDFAEGARIAEELPNAPGETIPEWRKKKRRLAYLAEEFLKRFNEGVADRELAATYLKTDGGHDEVIIEADTEGVATKAGDLPRRIPWVQVSSEQLYDFMKKKLISQSDVDGNLFLAVLAAEIGLSKKADQHREIAELVDNTGTARRRLGEYFEEK
jgi:hypothetical protein